MVRRVAFITGASRGIGACCAEALARQGYDIALTARTLSEGEIYEYGTWQSKKQTLPGSLESVAEKVSAIGREALCLQADILNPQTLLNAVEQVLSQWGHIDVLFNNACYQGPGNLFRILDITDEQLQNIYQGNIFSPLKLIKRILPEMLIRETGTIINMVSASAMQDPQYPADQGGWGFAYSSSKAALIRMVGILRVEHKESNLRFLNVEPGFVITELMKANGFSEEYAEKYGASSPEKTAAVIAWLCANEALDGDEKDSVISAPKLAKRLNLAAI